MTMSTVVMSSPQRTGASLRKTNKPLMEKRRRARINDSLSQLKSLVIQSHKKDSSQFNKLEKADILELTVKHLRTLQQEQLSQVNNDASSAGKYYAGFTECANEVIRYLGQSPDLPDDLKSRVVHHLASSIQLSNKLTFAQPVQSNTSVTNPPTLPAGHNSGQLINGQIVQVVNGHLPSIKPAIAGSFPGGVPVSIAALTSVSSPPAHIPAVMTSATTTAPSSEAPSFLKYTQPLQIQIPPVVSPINIRANTGQQQPDQSSMMYKIQDVPEQVVKVQDHPSQVNTQMTNPKQEPFISSHPSPSCRERSTSPASLITCQSSHKFCRERSTSPASLITCQSSHKFCRERSTSPASLITCQSSHKFYSHDSHYTDFLPRSRTYSLTSSSSDTELPSPLNLSQSPRYYDHRELNTQYPGSFGKTLPQAPTHSHTVSTHSHTVSSAHPATKHRLLLPISPMSNWTSVIVDGRKTVESHFMKYMHCIDDDRHFIRHEGSTSPASSVGEERLWRPW